MLASGLLQSCGLVVSRPSHFSCAPTLSVLGCSVVHGREEHGGRALVRSGPCPISVLVPLDLLFDATILRPARLRHCLTETDRRKKITPRTRYAKEIV